ncbi:MAG TPA: TIGR02300 family protein [Stellaceae bacterium]|nr:TIGR02300 family protein [Stellaceae bacterium]
MVWAAVFSTGRIFARRGRWRRPSRARRGRQFLLLTAAARHGKGPVEEAGLSGRCGGVVAKIDWGTKRICPNCGARYYDMRRVPIACPKCGAPFDLEALAKPRKTRGAPVPVPIPEEVVPIADEELEADLAAEPEESGAVVEMPVPVPAAAAEAEVEEAEAEEGAAGEKEEEEEEVIEDASELGEDEDDMAEVIENVDDEDER